MLSEESDSGFFLLFKYPWERHILYIGGKSSSPKMLLRITPTGIYLFTVNNRNARTMCETCSKLTIKTPEQCQWRRSGVFIASLKRFHTLFWCFYCWLWTSKCFLGDGLKIQIYTQLNIFNGSAITKQRREHGLME